MPAAPTLPGMHPRPFFLPLIAALSLGLMAAQALAERSPRPPAALGPVEGEVIVKFKAESATLRKTTLAARADISSVQGMLASRATTLGARVGRALETGAAVGDRSQVMRASGVSADALARQLAADPEVEYAVPNGRMRLLASTSDPLYRAGPAVSLANQVGGPAVGQWYLHAPDATLLSPINIEPAWDHTFGSSNVVVAVLDTGVRFEHPDLGRAANGGALLPGYDFVASSTVAGDGNGRDNNPEDAGDYVTLAESRTSTFSGCDPSDSSWHGTSTASLVGALANNGGMVGAAPGVRVLPVRVLGKCFGTDSDIQAAMLWAAGIPVPGVPDNPNPARVINMSLGGSGSCSASYQDVVNRVRAAGTVIVAAAGNSAGGPVSTPGNCSGVIAVLALRHSGAKVGFSDLGPEISIAAPGGNCVNVSAGSACLYPILAATDTGTQGAVASSWTDSFNASVGTSFSSPLVAGVAGLMISARPSLTPDQVRTAMRATARPFPTSGSDNGPNDPTAVVQCHAPVTGTDQYQCYCTTSLCGAGMLDAGAAVAAVAGPVARIDVSTAVPIAGSPVDLSAKGSTVGSGNTITGYAWTITDQGGIVTGFTSATNADKASITPTAAGSFTVQIVITDSGNATSTVTRTVSVAAAPVVSPPTTPPATSGGGGGAASMWWVLGVLSAALALLNLSRRAARRSD